MIWKEGYNPPMNEQNETKNTEEKEKKPVNWKSEIISWIQILVAAAVIAFVLNTFIIANGRVPSASMENTIMTGSRVIGSRLSYHFHEPERGDVVIFVFGYDCKTCGTTYQETPEGVCPVCGRADKRNSTIYYVKRIIGMPGDTIDIKDGHVYLNGSDTPLEEPYLHEEMETPKELHYEVPEDQYFMMGDNRNYSADARFWRFSYISKDKIIAKVLFKYFPGFGKIE